MSTLTAKSTMLVVKVRMPKEYKSEFIGWQTRLNTEIAAFPGFVSLEILSPSQSSDGQWAIFQRFSSEERLRAWEASKQYSQLIRDLKTILRDEAHEIEQNTFESSNLQSTVTEVFVTQVRPDKSQAYQEWTGKIHQIEAMFPGFRGVYFQSPQSDQSKNWITFLQFDTAENMDRWMNSAERKQILDQSESLINSIETHRVISPYSGWFASVTKDGKAPALWKQTMLILLVLFPIVMIEFKYLSPLLTGLNLSLSTFIGNAISVSLISWPMMPIAIGFLGWWLAPEGDKIKKSIYGFIIVLLLYLIEIGMFWNFFHK